MVKGIEIFKGYFQNFSEQYVLIGGVACDIVFEDADLSFRATKDFDMVLIIEALTPEFGKQFWDFINKGGYENRVKSNNTPQFYRFDKPKNPDFPYMIELFSRSDSIFDEEMTCRPLHLGEELSSLSAILLNDDYYDLLLSGKKVLSELSILTNEYIILFKAKAWLNLNKMKESGQSVDEKDIRKNKNDIARLASLLTGNEVCVVPQNVKKDIEEFVLAFENEPPDLKALKLTNIALEEMVDLMKSIYVVDG